MRQLWRDKAAMLAALVLAAILLACAAAPLYARLVSGTDPFRSNITGSITLNGTSVEVLQPSPGGLHLGVTPIGPSGHGPYLLGADGLGRDLAARLLYGGRISLLISGIATLVCLALATLVGIVAGYFGGIVDAVLARLLDLLWAFPVFLLAISLSIVLISGGLQLGPLRIEADSLALPVGVIAVIFIPYVARPIRGQVLTLQRSDFVLAAIGIGAPSWRILARDIMPHVATTLVVFAPLVMALNLLTESALSFLSIGVQPPAASWGTIIQDGQELLYTRPLVALAPGLAIVLVVVALNTLGDALRDALDPQARLRGRG